jgi:signal transduction histidine kinase
MGRMPDLLSSLVGTAVVLLSIIAFAGYGRMRRRQTSLAQANIALAGRLRVLEGRMLEASIVLDPEGLIRSINRAAEERFGYREADIRGADISQLIPEYRQPHEGRGVAAVRLADGSFRTFGFSQVLSEDQGSYLFFDEGVPGNGGKLPPMPALEVVEGVVSRIVRQLEGLLTVVNGYTELALRECDPDAPIRKDLEEIAAASDTASRLVLHLLAFSGNQLIPVEILDLNAMLEKLHAKLPAVQIEFCAKNLYVLGNAECLCHIVQLFSGSAQYRVGKAVPVQIVTSRRDVDDTGYAVIAISDSGPALAPATLAHLFEPLFLDREGLGVDLSAIHGAVGTLGGKITVVSEADRGTTFEILLPLTDVPSSCQGLTAREPGINGKERAT